MAYEKLFKAEPPAILLVTHESQAFDDFISEVQEERIEDDVTIHRLRGAKCRTAAGFFSEIGAVMQLPLYFGENWDALNDMFYNESWLPGTLFAVTDGHRFLEDEEPKELRNFVELADKCNGFYLKPPYKASEASDTGFHVLLQVPAGERKALEERLKAAGAEFADYEPE